MNKLFKKFSIVFLSTALILCSCTEKKAKYVFYFIGDGMGFSHIAATEAYLATLDSVVGSKPLGFTQFPAMGMATSHSANKYITCSSAAGTALSTGFKTNNGMLGVAPDSTHLESISYKFHRAGYRVGITSTVTLDHATPGSFYAHSAARSDYYNIGKELSQSGFEFFGGGSFDKPLGKENKERSLYDITQEAGYTIAYGLDDFNSKKGEAEKIILFQKEGKNSILPYVTTREEDDLTLPDIVSAAIEALENEKGFFLMAEGGLIDWGAHSNDITNTVFELIDFDQAIMVAYQFYLKHQKETLIVVTADHETGGITVGRGKGYNLYMDKIDDMIDKESDTTVDNYMSDKTAMSEVSEDALIGWTTTSHTGGAVPVFAIGAGSQRFVGRQDNTDIPKKICEAAGVKF